MRIRQRMGASRSQATTRLRGSRVITIDNIIIYVVRVIMALLCLGGHEQPLGQYFAFFSPPSRTVNQDDPSKRDRKVVVRGVVRQFHSNRKGELDALAPPGQRAAPHADFDTRSS